MKTLSIIAAALVSGAAYGHSPCPQWYDFPADMPVEEQNAKIDQWKENEDREYDREYQQFLQQQDREQAQRDREYQTELMEEMLDAIQDLDR